MKYLHLQENIQRGTMNFKLEYYLLNSTSPQYIMQPHWHDELEFIRIIEGEFCLQLENKELLLVKGDIAVVNLEMIHSGTPINCIYECIVFNVKLLSSSNEYISKLLLNITSKKITIFNKFKADTNNITNLFNMLFNSVKERNSSFEIATIGALYMIIGEIFSNNYFFHTPLDYVANQKKLIELNEVLHYIQINYANKINLSDLAIVANMSPNYFCSAFKDIFKQSPIDYLIEFRIEKATSLLLNNDMNITEISLACGFFDLSYFIKTFKKLKGVSPKKYLTTTYINNI